MSTLDLLLIRSGLVVGYTAMTLVVAAGVGALVAGTPIAMTVLTVAGGLYLTCLGAKALTNPVIPVVAAPEADETASRGGWATLARGIGVSGLNPKGLLLFVARVHRTVADAVLVRARRRRRQRVPPGR